MHRHSMALLLLCVHDVVCIIISFVDAGPVFAGHFDRVRTLTKQIKSPDPNTLSHTHTHALIIPKCLCARINLGALFCGSITLSLSRSRHLDRVTRTAQKG